jgi:hypothetical protein
MKEFLIRDEAAFKLRAKVSNCINPSTLKCLEFTGECYNDKGEKVDESTYQFFLEEAHIKTMCEGLLA